MSENEKLLRELCEVDDRWRVTYTENGLPTAICLNVSPHYPLHTDDDGQIHGGEALWGMLQEMRERWDWLPLGDSGLKVGTHESHTLAALMLRNIEDASSEFIIQAYIAWKRTLSPSMAAVYNTVLPTRNAVTSENEPSAQETGSVDATQGDQK